jgi:hypothetical protein
MPQQVPLPYQVSLKKEGIEVTIEVLGKTRAHAIESARELTGLNTLVRCCRAEDW